MNINFSLPLQEPVLVFSIILFIILFTPIVLNKIKIPAIIGLIVAGMLIGPNGFNLLARNESIKLFGTVGLLYIMFLAGLEIDLNEFKKNKYKSMVFGAYTFFIPMILGTGIFYYFLEYTMMSSILIASMFASHTLLTYPMVSKLGISKNLAVNVTVGGTMITDTASLLVLAIVVGTAKGEIGPAFWAQLTISMALFAVIVLWGFPILSRWFFKQISDSIAQYIFVLGIVFFSSFLALMAGVEAIIGAFLAGLALNRLIPRTGPLMNRIEFVGNALFIPFFLIGVGMLVDYRVFFNGFEAIMIAGIMTVVALLGKYLPAYLTQKTYGFSRDQRMIIFGLSNSQAAATLAAVLIGYNFILGTAPDGSPIRLLDENILNGTIVMILITCTISSFATQKAALGIAKADLQNVPAHENTESQKTLVGLANEATAESLIQLAIITVDKRKNKDLYGLHIIVADRENAESINNANKLLEKAEKYTASADFKLHPLLRYDINIASGIINTVKEQGIRHFYIGLHEKASLIGNYFGSLTNDLLAKNDSAIYIHKSHQPLSTIKKFIVAIPANAELELGFNEWYSRVMQMADNSGNAFEIFADAATTGFLQKQKNKHSNVSFKSFDDFEEFQEIAKEIIPDTMLIVALARKEGISYQPSMDKLKMTLTKHFKNVSLLLIYPNNFGRAVVEGSK